MRQQQKALNNVSKKSTLLLLSLMMLLGSCGKSSYSTFSKPNEKYRSAREIAEMKKRERMARRSGSKKPLKEIHISSGRGRNTPGSIHLGSNRAMRRDIETVISTARSYTGTPYQLGGTSRIGMDCSGLLCTSFQAIDVMLPRTSTEQSQFGLPISTQELQAGDLVFFSSSKSEYNITHVGMVTEVRNQNEVLFIHASTSLGVKEDNLFAPYYQKIFVKAVRPAI